MVSGANFGKTQAQVSQKSPASDISKASSGRLGTPSTNSGSSVPGQEASKSSSLGLRSTTSQAILDQQSSSVSLEQPSLKGLPCEKTDGEQ